MNWCISTAGFGLILSSQNLYNKTMPTFRCQVLHHYGVVERDLWLHEMVSSLEQIEIENQ